jgi:hypothetical protein
MNSVRKVTNRVATAIVLVAQLCLAGCVARNLPVSTAASSTPAAIDAAGDECRQFACEP